LRRTLGLGVVTALLIAPGSFAGLGDHADSINTDQRMLSAKRGNADVYRAYSVQTMESDATTVTEYLNNDGVIFAVTWQGLDHPDLSVILGSYYAGFQKTEKEQPRVKGQKHHTVQKEDLVVQKWGQMRNLRGRAYDPSLFPTGVTINEIK
jgi:hypothetical protein